MKVANTLWLGWFCVALCLGGCENYRTIDTGSMSREQLISTELVGRSRLWVPDVPVPLRFNMDKERSRSWATGGFRVVDHRYVGRGDKLAVGRFYRREMKNSQWTNVSDLMIQGSILLRFVKGRERCEVNITDASIGRTEVIVNIFPETNTGGVRKY